MLIRDSHNFLLHKIKEILTLDLYGWLFAEDNGMVVCTSPSSAPNSAATPSTETAALSAEFPSIQEIRKFQKTQFFEYFKADCPLSELITSTELWALYYFFKKPDVENDTPLDKMIYRYPLEQEDKRSKTIPSAQFVQHHYTADVLLQILWATASIGYSTTSSCTVFAQLLTLLNEVRFLLFLKSQIVSTSKNINWQYLCQQSLNFKTETLQPLVILCSSGLLEPSLAVLSLHADFCSDSFLFHDGADKYKHVITIEQRAELERHRLAEMFDFSNHTVGFLHISLRCGLACTVKLQAAKNRIYDCRKLIHKHDITRRCLQTFIEQKKKKGILSLDTGINDALLNVSNITEILVLSLSFQYTRRSPQDLAEGRTIMFYYFIDLWENLAGSRAYALCSNTSFGDFLQRLVQCLNEDSFDTTSRPSGQQQIYELFKSQQTPIDKLTMAYKYWSFCFLVLVPKWHHTKYQHAIQLMGETTDGSSVTVANSRIETLLTYLSTGRLHTPGFISSFNWLGDNFNNYLKFCCAEFKRYADLQKELSRLHAQEKKSSQIYKIKSTIEKLENQMRDYHIHRIFKDGGLPAATAPSLFSSSAVKEAKARSAVFGSDRVGSDRVLIFSGGEREIPKRDSSSLWAFIGKDRGPSNDDL